MSPRSRSSTAKKAPEPRRGARRHSSRVACLLGLLLTGRFLGLARLLRRLVRQDPLHNLLPGGAVLGESINPVRYRIPVRLL